MCFYQEMFVDPETLNSVQLLTQFWSNSRRKPLSFGINHFSQTFQTASSFPACLSVPFQHSASKTEGWKYWELDFLGSWLLSRKSSQGFQPSCISGSFSSFILSGEQQKLFKMAEIRFEHCLIYLSNFLQFVFIVKFHFPCQFRMVPLTNSTYCAPRNLDSCSSVLWPI